MTYPPQPNWGSYYLSGQTPVAPAGPLAGPIISESPWRKLAPARAHVAVVLLHRRGDHEVVWPHARKRAWWRKPRTQYEIDLGLHHTEFETDVPSGEDAFQFHATVNVSWRVIDPSAVARHRVYDVKEALAPPAQLRIRAISRGFDITRCAAAEDTINEQLGALRVDVTDPAQFAGAMAEALRQDYLGAEYGLWTRTIVRLTLDGATIEHDATMKRLNRAIKEEEAAQTLRRLQQQNEHVNLTDRISVYREIVAAGDMDRFALQLANNREDIAAINAIIRDEELVNRRDTVDFISRMVETGAVERHQIGDQVMEALAWLKEATDRVIRDGQPKPVEGPPRRRGRTALTDGSANGGVAADGAAPPPKTTTSGDG